MTLRQWMGSFAAAAMLNAQALALEVKPVVDAQLLGGQNYYSGSESSFGGVASLSAAPYMKFDDRWSLVPLYVGNYHGTKQVTDLLGGGTLFTDSQDHTFSSKVIRSFSNGVKLKAVGGYGVELLRETKDEDWGKGLYDNRRAFGGTEAEWSWDKDRFVRLAYDYYKIHFPNYQSLESSSGLGRELAAPDVLNNANHAVTLAGRVRLPADGFADVTAGYTNRQYKDQHLVDISGDLISETRKDSIQSLAGQATWPISVKNRTRLFTALGYSWTHLYSNQNNYDANQVRFNANYYSYVTQTVSNQWTLLGGESENPWAVTLNGALARQQYADRPVQDQTGIYGTDATHVDSVYVGAVYSYPIAKGFHLSANVYLGWNDSNNQDNRTYQYHYDTQTYLMGFTYAY
jgi:hypothetical protein